MIFRPGCPAPLTSNAAPQPAPVMPVRSRTMAIGATVMSPASWARNGIAPTKLTNKMATALPGLLRTTALPVSVFTIIPG